MRKEWAQQKGLRRKFKAVFSRIGKKINYRGRSEETILLTDIVDLETQRPVSSHCWFSFTQGFMKAGLKEGKEGAVIEFEARIKEYRKGYVNTRAGIDQRSTDYKLSNPTKILMLPSNRNS